MQLGLGAGSAKREGGNRIRGVEGNGLQLAKQIQVKSYLVKHPSVIISLQSHLLLLYDDVEARHDPSRTYELQVVSGSRQGLAGPSSLLGNRLGLFWSS